MRYTFAAGRIPAGQPAAMELHVRRPRAVPVDTKAATRENGSLTLDPNLRRESSAEVTP